MSHLAAKANHPGGACRPCRIVQYSSHRRSTNLGSVCEDESLDSSLSKGSRAYVDRAEQGIHEFPFLFLVLRLRRLAVHLRVAVAVVHGHAGI